MKPFPLTAAVVLAVYITVRGRRLERAAVAAGALVVAGLLVYGTGLVHPPSLEHVLLSVGDRLGKLTYLLVGVLAFLETGAFIGLVAPGETAILLGGVVAGQGKIEVVTLVAIVWACAVAGDLTSFALGRRLGRSFLERHGARVKITEERLRQVEAFFGRHGGKAILLGRFVGFVRAVAPFLAGSSRMALRRFIPYDVIGAGLWGTSFVLLGFIFWHSLDQVLAIARRGALALSGVIVVAVGIGVAVRWLRQPGNRERAGAWLSKQAERPAVRPLARVARLLARRVQSPARFVWARVTPGELGLELTTLLAIALVGGFAFGAYAYILTTMSFTAGDLRALQLVDRLRTSELVDVAQGLTWLGALPVAGGAVAAAAVFLLARRRWLEGLALLGGMGLTIAAVQIAKAAEERPRPAGALADTAGASFPSGHTAYAVGWVAVAVALRHALPGLGTRAAAVTVAAGVVVIVGATRIYLRAHFLSDVLGGAGLAAALFAVCGMVALLVGHVRNNSRLRP